MRDALFALVTNPTAATYGELLRQVTSQPDFQIYSDDMRLLRERFEAGDFAGVHQAINAVMRFWIHSPEIHLMAWSVARRLGDAETENLERRITEACIVGMQSSGDGSLTRPYQVAHVDDEYALLRFMNLQCTRQGSMARDGRTVDVFHCADGRTLHFELPGVGGPFARPAVSAGPSEGDLPTVRVRLPPARRRGARAQWRRPLVIAAIVVGAAVICGLILG